MFPVDHNIEFIRQKIMQVKTGLCCIDDDYFAVRAHIVEVLYFDDDGNLYFSIFNPMLSYTEYAETKNFGISLTFYKKSFDYYVQLKAEATIEKNETENNNDNEGCGSFILIKAKVIEADYVEHKKPFASNTMFDNVKDGFRKFSKAVAMLFY